VDQPVLDADPDPDPKFPLEADPDPYPTSIKTKSIHIRIFTQVGNQIFYTFSHGIASLQCLIFLNSHQCVRCRKFEVLWSSDHIKIY
jgi:hypothetical protein